MLNQTVEQKLDALIEALQRIGDPVFFSDLGEAARTLSMRKPRAYVRVEESFNAPQFFVGEGTASVNETGYLMLEKGGADDGCLLQNTESSGHSVRERDENACLRGKNGGHRPRCNILQGVRGAADSTRRFRHHDCNTSLFPDQTVCNLEVTCCRRWPHQIPASIAVHLFHLKSISLARRSDARN